MTYELYTDWVLTTDLPECGLRRGNRVRLVEHHEVRDVGEDGYSVEVLNATGSMPEVTAIPTRLLRGAVRVN